MTVQESIRIENLGKRYHIKGMSAKYIFEVTLIRLGEDGIITMIPYFGSMRSCEVEELAN